MIEVEDYTEDSRVEEYTLECEDRSAMWVLYYALNKLIVNPTIGPADRPLSKKGYGMLVDWIEDLEEALEKR